MRNEVEYQHQCALFQWRDRMLNEWPELKWMFGSLVGVYLPIGLAMKAKKAGVSRGILDVCLPVRRGNCPGMWFDMKSKVGSIKPEQKAFAEYLSSQGWVVGFLRDWEIAASEIITYLKREK